MKKKFHEHLNRTLLKALTYRFFILISDFAIIFTLTHRYDVTIGMLILSNVASSVFYIVHERFWNNIHWGKI